MASVASETFTSTSAPIQYAAVRAFEGGEEIDVYVRRSRRALGALGASLTRRLGEAGVEVVPPDGGFYLFPSFAAHAEALRKRGVATSAEFCGRLLVDTGVAILPGQDFGRPPEELTARIAYVNFDGERVLEAIAGLPPEGALDEEFLRRHCPVSLTP